MTTDIKRLIPELPQSFDGVTLGRRSVQLFGAVTQGPRSYNMDAAAVAFSPQALVMVVCDGAGGHPGSEQLSDWLVNVTADRMLDLAECDFGGGARSSDARQAVDSTLRDLASATCNRFSSVEIGRRGLVSTMSVVVMNPEHTVVATVGDSPVNVELVDDRQFCSQLHNGWLPNILARCITDRWIYDDELSRFDVDSFRTEDVKTVKVYSDGVDHTDADAFALGLRPIDEIFQLREPFDNRALLVANFKS